MGAYIDAALVLPIKQKLKLASLIRSNIYTMGSPKRYTLDHLNNIVKMILVIMSISLLVSWSNQVMGSSSHEEARVVTYMKHKRLPLLQREAHARAFSSFLVTESQLERQSVLQEIAITDDGRIQFLKAKLGEASSESNSASLSGLSTPLYSGHIVNTANYLMTIGLGTPASELLMVIDTGSDLAWTQCLPCGECYSQRDAIFNPTASKTYRKVPCASHQCAQMTSTTTSTCSHTTACEYLISYLDGSFTAGEIATDAMSVNGEVVASAYPFGCGHENEGLFTGYDGLVGLSRSAVAFPTQTKVAFDGVFAYCMPPLLSKAAGYIEFGRRRATREVEVEKATLGDAKANKVANFDLVTIPLVGVSASSLYVVTIESIKVQGRSNTTSNSKGFNIVVDSGTVITRLDRNLYTAVKTAFTKAATTGGHGVKEAPLSTGLGLFDACFSTATATATNPAKLFPTVTFTFLGGFTFTPSVQNMVIPVDTRGTYCLALLPLDSPSRISILGNYQQQSHLFTFDVARSTLSISSRAC